MNISAMKILLLGLSLCLVLSSFHEVSCQDDGSGLSTLDIIERDYQDSVTALQGNEDDNQSVKTQSENQNSTVTDKNTISLSLSNESEGSLSDSVDNSIQSGSVSDGSIQHSSLLDQMELEFEAASNSLKQLRSDGLGKGSDEEELAKRQSLLDEIEREFETATKELAQIKVNEFTGGEEDAEQSAKRKSMFEAMEREFEAAVEELKVIGSTSSNDDAEQSAHSLSMIEEIEREFEAATKSLQDLKANDPSGDNHEEEHVAQRPTMLDEIEREFQAATDSLKNLQVDYPSGDEEHSAKRQNMLEEIEREFEAATKELKQLNEGNVDDEHSAKRNQMLEDIEREFEAATKGLEQLNDLTDGNNNDEQSAKRQSMLDEIEREFEAALGGLKQINAEKNIDEHELSSKRNILLEKMEREFEEAHSSVIAKAAKGEPAKKQSSSIIPEALELGQSGVCGCFNQDNGGLKQDEVDSIVIPTKISIEEIFSEKSLFEGTETSSLTASLTHLVQNHRKEKESLSVQGVSTSYSSSSSTSESAATSETVETLRAKLKELRGLTARELVTRKDFDQILIMAASFEELTSASVSYISRLARYRNVIKEGLEASERVHIAQVQARMLKEAATEKQTSVDIHFAEAKTLAQKGDALFVRIFAIKKLLAKLEAERASVDVEFKKTVHNLSHLLVSASEAYEEYHGAVRKAKDEQAAEEFAIEATQSAEIIWVKFLSSL